MTILQTTSKEKGTLRKFMFKRINDFYSTGCLLDTGIYDKFSVASDYEVEEEFKLIYKLNTKNSYFGA